MKFREAVLEVGKNYPIMWFGECLGWFWDGFGIYFK